MNWLDNILWSIFLWIGKRYFSYLSVYAPQDNVDAVTFSKTEEYLNKIEEKVDK